MLHNLRRLSLPVACALLAACGGGGGGGPANQAPVAVATLKGEAVLYGTTVFDSSGSSDIDGSISTRSWDYGDGSTGGVDSHVYTRTGNFRATLTVTDDDGATDSKGVDVTVVKCSAAGTRASTLSPLQTVCIQTTRGEMVVELFAAEAPQTTKSFLQYVDEGFYNGTLFHSVTNLKLDAGGYTTGLTPKAATHAAIPLESNNGLKNWQYTVAMDRGAAANSATTRFFINLVDNHQFDFNPAVGTPNGFAVFGQLIAGTDVAEAIGSVATATTGGIPNVPRTEVVIRSAVKMK